MTVLLAIESIGRSGSVCLADAMGIIGTITCTGPSETTLVAAMHELAQRQAPEALAVAVGPGSFTGLRVGLSAVRTWAWLERLPVYPVDSLVAMACERGDGLWWCLLPLKRDTTFHAVVRVVAGRPEVVVPSSALLDRLVPSLPVGLEPVAIGPALRDKPDLLTAWRPGTVTGDPGAPSARGVALAARHVSAVSWESVLPAYLQEPAPVLQRAAQQAPPLSAS